MSTVRIEQPSTWVKYRKGLCEGCWSGCCTLPVEVSASDLIRLGLITEEEAALSLKQVAKKLLKQKVIQAYQARSQLFVLAQKSGRDCLFLDENRLCQVYAKRPEVCRKFPAIGPRPGFCPKTWKTESKRPSVTQKRSLKKTPA
ncbi:MAG: YkgJ family cysteine cluster protein [Bdellovibrionia bacterium]